MTYEEFTKLDDDFEVCLCRGVTLGEVKAAISNGCNTVEAIMEETDAGTACELCQTKEIDEDNDRELRLDEILEYTNR